MKYYQYVVIVDALYNPVLRDYKCDNLHAVKEYLQRVVPCDFVLDKDGWRKDYGFANVLHYLYGDFTDGNDYYYVIIKRIYLGGKNIP